MEEDVAESGAETGTVRSAPDQPARRAADRAIELLSQRVAESVKREQNAEGGQECDRGLERASDDPRHRREPHRRAPEIRLIFPVESEPECAPANRKD